MCTCASCEYTDAFAANFNLFGVMQKSNKTGFADWPRGDPAGKRVSESEYRSHVSHLWAGVAKAVPFKPGQPPQYPAWTRGNGPIQQAPKFVIDWINRKQESKGPTVSPAPARPTEPCKAPQHFPERDRAHETATIYAMPKSQPKDKRPVGRPAIGRRVVVNLEEEHIKRAEKLGGGNVSAGIRKALAR